MRYFDVLSLWLWHIFWDDDTWSLLSVSVLLCHHRISNVALGSDTLGTGQTLKKILLPSDTGAGNKRDLSACTFLCLCLWECAR